MRTKLATTLAVAAALLLGLWAADWAAGNGGPFVVKHPSGDPAAKGVLARLDPTLKPARETRLRVVKEDLSVQFERWDPRNPPMADVTAAYTIENPTDQEVQVDFGFPILRGIYMVNGMFRSPAVSVKVDTDYVPEDVISNSVIYGMIREHARACIEKGIAADVQLSRLVQAVRDAHQKTLEPPGNGGTQPPQQTRKATSAAVKTFRAVVRPDADPAREALRAHLVTKLKWNGRDAALLVEYASLDLGPTPDWPHDRWDTSSRIWMFENEPNTLLKANLGPLVVIGEQKATQFFAQLASRFDKEVAATYESIFTAWGGDVRERSVDLGSGKVRPRELSSVPERQYGDDPTVYARLDYINPDVKLPPAHKASCETVLRNLPVTFTFAPMNLLHYEVKFPAKTTRLVTITYRQFAYIDTASPASYQLAYVLHPASLWQEFGPINLTVRVPKGIACKASAAVEKADDQQVYIPSIAARVAMDVYKTTLTEAKQKQGELFIGIDRAVWDEQVAAAAKEAAKKRAEEEKGGW